MLQGECYCQDHCNLASHFNAQVKLIICEKAAMEIVEVTQAEPEGEEQMDHGLGAFFSRTDLDIEAVLGTPTKLRL